jgi:hypothetical protein
MNTQKKKGTTTVNTTRKMKTKKKDFGTMRRTVVRWIWKSIQNYDSQLNDYYPGQGVKMENAEELKNQHKKQT